MNAKAPSSRRVALATWNGRISPVFDVARQVLVLDVEGGRTTARHEERLPGTEPAAQASRLAALAPQVLICGAISQPMRALLASTGIAVIPFTAGAIDEVLSAWLAGRLPCPALSMPGCCGGRRRCQGGSPHRRGQRWSLGLEAPAPREPAAPPVGGTRPMADERQTESRAPLVARRERNSPMKIAVTSTGNDMTSPVDPRFGRARVFMVVDTETLEATAHDNTPNLNAAQGAGIQAGETVARLGAAAVITGNVGPKAFRMLKAAGIKVHLAGAGTVAEAVRRFKAGELPEVSAANVEGHWA